MGEFRGRIWRWFSERAHGPHAKAWLFALSFAEATFFVIPIDALLVAILLVNSSRWIFHAFLAGVASALGAIFGYVVGAFFYDTVGAGIIDFYNLVDEFERVAVLFDKNTFLTIFVAAVTPLPFKAFVLAGGLFKVNIIAFALASLLGRIIRYGLVAYIIRIFGEHITYLFMRYTNIATMAVIAILFVILLSAFGIPLIP